MIVKLKDLHLLLVVYDITSTEEIRCVFDDI